MSRELILHMTMSLDGFIAGPNGEFDWAFPAMSDEGRQWVAEQFSLAGRIALGHKSYLGMAGFWATAENPIAHPMNEVPKAVFSRSGVVSPPNIADDAPDRARESWLNPFVGGADLVADIQRLKAEEGGPIIAIGGVSFANSLIATGLIDVFRLSVHPVALGKGMPLFGGLEAPLRFKLEDLKLFETGGMVKTLRPCY